MESTCPKCLAQVVSDGEDGQFHCTCGYSFQVSDPGDDLPPIGGPQFAETKPAEASAGAGGEGAIPSGPEEHFKEAENTFAEIRDFGEELSRSSLEAQNSAEGAAPAAKPEPTDSEALILLAGVPLVGYQIQRYFAPISCETTPSAEGDPLQAAYLSLWEQAQKQGANGVLGVQWSVSGDFTKIWMSGTPVSCSKD